MCTGCQWQHIEYSYQLELKRAFVEEQMARYDNLKDIFVSPAIPSPQQFNYRNHARFTARNRGSLGYINRLTRRFVEIEGCMLMAPWINETLRNLQGKCQETTQLSIRYGINTGDWLIQPTFHSPEIPLATGQTHYTERLLGHAFRIASPSFAQVNTPQAERMALLVHDRLEPDGSELLVDAYAGVGTFAVLLADSVRRVIAIEESSAAVKDAAANIEGIDNLEYIEGKTEEVLDTLEETPDAVILDPPRVGCHPDTLGALIRCAPKRIVYISCDPESLARDLSILIHGGFQVELVEPVDMFPQTHHIECVAALQRD
jgi:23S rRNA (uracil1939-C5)-methyltransferase